LPEDVSKEKIHASYTDGVLSLSLPKKDEAKKLNAHHTIQVK